MKQRHDHPSAEHWSLQPTGRQLAELGVLAGPGDVEVVIDSVYELSGTGLRAAQERSESHNAVGKITIDVDTPIDH